MGLERTVAASARMSPLGRVEPSETRPSTGWFRSKRSPRAASSRQAPQPLRSPAFTLYNIFYRECRCEQGFGDPFYPNPGPIAPLRAVKKLSLKGATRRGNVSCPAFSPTYVRPYCKSGSNRAMSTEPLRGSDVISVRELADMRSAGKEHTVLDVREARELDVCRLEGALHIPMAEIPARTDDLPTDQLLVVICHHGARSQMVVDFLRSAGFDNAVNLDGGIDAWACDIDQSMPRYR